uniref:Uncharacterized protein n=1 Tax=Romanomermis culicivorax TaxID=13658 RepID=A0A915IEX6_ROMCU
MTNAKISIGFTSYGSNVYEQKRAALMVESHKSGISVVSLFQKIYLNYFVQSILLPSNHVASPYLTFSIVAVARESQDEMKIPQLLEIPVKIHNYTKVDGVEKVLTERLYAHANWLKTLA